MGKYSATHVDHKGKMEDEKLLGKFYKRFPALKVMPEVFNYRIDKKTLGMRPTFMI